jgi:hypothetical protein
LLSWPIMYNSPLFNVKGYVFLTNLCFYCSDKVPSICHVVKKSFISFSHSNSL